MKYGLIISSLILLRNEDADISFGKKMARNRYVFWPRRHLLAECSGANDFRAVRLALVFELNVRIVIVKSIEVR